MSDWDTNKSNSNQITGAASSESIKTVTSNNEDVITSDYKAKFKQRENRQAVKMQCIELAIKMQCIELAIKLHASTEISDEGIVNTAKTFFEFTR